MKFEHVAFDLIVQDKTGGNQKIQQADYLQEGRYPIIDQGKNFIAGYTDEEDFLICGADLPVVVFGDHTKIVKYIDFPFALGADGVKILKCNSNCTEKYLYHFLNYIELPDAGYSRHFKFLKRIEIPLPPLETQRRIAAILDQADALRQKRQQAIAKLDELVQATFIDMFGDPVTNPKGWPIAKLNDLGNLDRGVSKHRPRGAPELLGGIHPLIQTGDVSRSNGFIKEYSYTYSDVGLKQSKKWPKGTLCITIAANIANTGILDFEACFPDSVVGFTSNHSSNIHYVQGVFSFLREILEETAPQSAQKNINLAILRALDIPKPPIHLQDKWGDIALKIEDQRVAQKKQLAAMETLFKSLQHQAFNGELT